MASKDEIRLLYTDELKKSQQYQIVLDMKQKILESIIYPNVQTVVPYVFTDYQSDYEISVIQQCFLLEFGFQLTNISNTGAGISLINFLV